MIYLAPYRLHTVQPLNSQETNLHVDGVLLRHEDGVGCVQPWVSLGDRPLDEHLAHLARGHVTPLVARALDCCRWDGAARRAGVSLWAGVSIPASHATLAHAPTPAEIAELVSQFSA